jgi:hypothetical protein
MSISRSLPPEAPTLAEVLIQRTFAKPPQPFVDGDFIKALSHADDDHPKVTAEPAEPDTAPATSPSSTATPGSIIDVRA